MGIDFDYYIDFFHDGSMDALDQDDGWLKCNIRSAELLAEENLQGLNLVEDSRLEGVLIFEGIRDIRINDQFFRDRLQMAHDSASIRDFEVRGDTVELGILWSNYPPKPWVNDWWTLEIEADEIFWEDALNSIRIKLNGLYTDGPVTDSET